MNRYKYKEIIKQYNELLKIINNQNIFTPTNDDILKNQDVLNLAEERGYIVHTTLPHATHYKVIGNLNDFNEWLITCRKEEKRLCFKEWALVFVGAIGGALFTNLSDIINFIIHIFNSCK